MADRDDSDGPFLSARQRTVLRFIAGFFRSNGYGPTHREIAGASGLASTSSVAYQVGQLVKKGCVTHDPRRPRTIVPVDHTFPAAGPEASGAADQRLTTMRLIGSISAGYGTIAYESVEDTLTVSEQLVGSGDLMALRVTGESMINAGIAHGDIVVVRRQPDARNGEIVAALVESETTHDYEATVKTLKRIEGHLWLIPHNPAFDPFLADNAQIIGKVVSVLRRL
jgi:repressor LexA